MKYLLVLLLSLSALSADSFVWKVSKNGVSIYLAGTIHVLKQSDYPLPLEFDEAYHASDILVVEADTSVMQDQAFVQKMMQMMKYTKGKSLRSELSPKVYMKLKKEAVKLGINMEAMDQFKISMIIMNLTMMELQKAGVDTEGVDAFYVKKANQDIKKIKYFESAEFQMNLIANMGQGNEDDMVLQTLDEMSELSTSMQEITQLWRAGDKNGLNKLLLKDMILEYPKLYDEILVQRNLNWVPKIIEMFKSKEIEYVLVGSMHLVGPDGLLAMLKKRGYKIEQL